MNIHRIVQSAQIACQRCGEPVPAIMMVAHDDKMICRSCAMKESPQPELVKYSWSRAINKKAGPLPVYPPVGWYRTKNGVYALHSGEAVWTIRVALDETCWDVALGGLNRRAQPIKTFERLCDAKAWVMQQIAPGSNASVTDSP